MVPKRTSTIIIGKCCNAIGSTEDFFYQCSRPIPKQAKEISGPNQDGTSLFDRSTYLIHPCRCVYAIAVGKKGHKSSC